MKRIKPIYCIGFVILCAFGVGIFVGFHDSANKAATSKTHNSTSNKFTEKEKVEDFNYLYKTLKENYPYFEVNKRVNGVDWLANKEKYERLVKESKSNKDFGKALGKILIDLKNDSSFLVTKEDYSYFLSDYYNEKNSSNKYWRDILKQKKVAELYKKDDIYTTADAASQDVKLKAEIASRLKGDNNGPLEMAIIIPNKVAYVKIPTFDSNSVEEDNEKLARFFEEVKNYPKLIIDIRGNNSYNIMYWVNNIFGLLLKDKMEIAEYFFAKNDTYIKHLQRCFGSFSNINILESSIIDKCPPEVKKEFKFYSKYTHTVKPRYSINYNGKVFVLIDKGVSSSAEVFLHYCKESKWATVIGEKTGGKSSSVGTMIASLPNTGYVFNFPVVMTLNPDFSPIGEKAIEPDVEANAAVGSNFEEDLCIQEAIKR